MRTELRFLLAIGLMLLVLVGTNLLFPPVPQEPAGVAAPDSAGMVGGGREVPFGVPDTAGAPARPESIAGGRDTAAPGAPPVRAGIPPEAAAPGRSVVVEGPLFRYTFSTVGARLTSAELPGFRSLRPPDGPVELIPDGTSALGQRLMVAGDTLDLRGVPFDVEPEDGITLREGGEAGTLRFRFRYTLPTADLTVELTYTFHPDAYLVEAAGRITGLDRPLVVTELGEGLAFNEADSTAEAGMMGFVGNHLQEGIDATPLRNVEARTVRDGPFLWVAFKSKHFVMALLAGPEFSEGGDDYLGGLIAEPVDGPSRARVSVTQPVGADGTFDYDVFAGPQEYARLSALGEDLEEVNPYGWRFLRPVVRPIVGVIMFCLNFLHNTLGIGYGWVLILFGILMRVLLWPLYMKSMRAQMKNMRVQPLLKEIQTKYKDNPERLQKEMMKLYKEHGFNPLAGCLPMLLPWPVLVALFFVFQNTIELRGVEFLWLPDLSAHDPLYILPVFLALSMFLLQFISYRSMGQDNQQMKMMMWIMPFFFGFIFMRFASGLNLYYATANLATIPQQVIVAKERRKVKAQGPVT
ncbi:MAG TPA: membrane protein insertase YidC [Longimicrobiales bacterium]|nr:membrane protein insertase YidC [Longimicrobiales bacterium]